MEAGVVLFVEAWQDLSLVERIEWLTILDHHQARVVLATDAASVESVESVPPDDELIV